MFRHAPSRVGRGRRAAVDIVVCFGWGGIFWGRSFPIFFFFETTRPAASMRPPCLIYLSTSSICEIYARPISTNPGFLEAGEYGLYRLTRGTCFLACRLELDAVAGMLWISWYVLGGADFFSVFVFRFFFPSNSHGLLQV